MAVQFTNPQLKFDPVTKLYHCTYTVSGNGQDASPENTHIGFLESGTFFGQLGYQLDRYGAYYQYKSGDRLAGVPVSGFGRAEREIKAGQITQNMFDSLVSLTYNIGVGALKKSSVIRHLKNGDKQKAGDAFLLWRNAGGKPILLKRRQKERAVFLA